MPFSGRSLIGVIIKVKNQSDIPRTKLKSITEIIDDTPIFDEGAQATLAWLTRYYLAPIGEVYSCAMPANLRKGKPFTPTPIVHWELTENGRSRSLDELSRAPLQLALIKRFNKQPQMSASDFSSEAQNWRQAIRALTKKGWLHEVSVRPKLSVTTSVAKPKTLNSEQSAANEALQRILVDRHFKCALLNGVTGSGKTEVYFSAMRTVLARGQQVLLLVPEIGLTPQLITRIQTNFKEAIAVLHSGLSDRERHLYWWYAREGSAKIIIGTRSAVFTPLKCPGLIVIDEEHDASFKQQDGVRYQARDVAVYRAKQLNIPIILGSATPSLESYHNALTDRYTLLRLTHRASAAALPTIELLDTRSLPVNDGLSSPLLQAIKSVLKDGKQVMLFLNRRGYAPVIYCTSCGATGRCHRCDTHLTYHQKTKKLRCHHCGYEIRATGKCQSCNSDNLAEIGEGTQRVEEALIKHFPDARVLRIDRDSTRRKGELEALLSEANNHYHDILLGTQLLTKGHDFPSVGLVGVLGSDNGLYSTEFRAREHLMQQILQVAGRAGRRNKTGLVYIQTAFPNELFFKFVKAHDYTAFAESLLLERQQANYPPYTYLALLRAESPHQNNALQFLRRMRQELIPITTIKVNDAIAAPMERRAGRFRAQLLIESASRAALNAALSNWLTKLASNKNLKSQANKVRWSLDIDPVDLY